MWNYYYLERTAEKAMAPHSSTLAWKIHGQWSLVGRSPWGHKESDTTERLPFHFSLSCIGEGNSNPLQCSCLENPRDGRAWWASVYGVAQSWTRLKRLSSSSNMLRTSAVCVNWRLNIHHVTAEQGSVRNFCCYVLRPWAAYLTPLCMFLHT